LEELGLQNSTTRQARILKSIIENGKSGLKHAGHGFVAFFGFIIINFYISFLGMNLIYGNRFAFVPGLMLLTTPLVLIIMGALNSYSMKFIYHRLTSQHWVGLLGQGFLVGLSGLLLSWLWGWFLFTIGMFIGTILNVNFYILFALDFLILFIPSLGYVTKEVSIFFTGVALEEIFRDE